MGDVLTADLELINDIEAVFNDCKGQGEFNIPMEYLEPLIHTARQYHAVKGGHDALVGVVKRATGTLMNIDLQQHQYEPICAGIEMVIEKLKAALKGEDD